VTAQPPDRILAFDRIHERVRVEGFRLGPVGRGLPDQRRLLRRRLRLLPRLADRAGARAVRGRAAGPRQPGRAPATPVG